MYSSHVLATGGTLVLGSRNSHIGPGQVGLLELDDVTRLMTFHYYDASNGGTPTLGLATLSYSDGWPVLDTSICPYISL
eukprot:m.25983 g.25983  ORF g.25983 m.25983 type:complete len:79 (-) comp11650_c0_seq3:1440-1676(-)